MIQFERLRKQSGRLLFVLLLISSALALGMSNMSPRMTVLVSAQTQPTPRSTRPRIVAANRSTGVPDLGPHASLHGKQLFPPDNPWNQDISSAPVDPNSARLIAAIGNDGQLHPDFGTVYRGVPNGIPYIVVGASQPLVPINFTAYGEIGRA